ncbi:hypothetical protein B0A54_12978 [Friedmanniomyces endolithicus]|uniref:Phenol 2-monooxygenase n=1 Tax=Friedmanniomyces endolithicus TaxID=329885 RepID=A0A4V5N8A7_9PEZI|nr:hypothetical protein LTS09_001105 [Friedmanniomyces endolithicus]TKA35809.1 hypothetical protein B0A54_12978 [Friedmanniomyces endolithicus]
MQFHLNGFKGSGDPLQLLHTGEQEPDFQSSLPEEVDVLIIGAGPAGQLLGTQLSRFPNITTRIIESKPARLEQGQADGLQCRTIEIFEAFGFSERVLKEAYWVNETTFWSPTEDGKGLRRTGRIRDTEEGLSEFPHVILNQARLHDLWLDAMKGSATRLEPSYSRQMSSLAIPEDGPVEVEIERVDEAHKGQKETVRAKYVVGCDGARSGVRRAMGYEMKGDFANQAWGVMDALVVTDFPDLRLKTAIHSANEGSVLIIPREGGYLARFYIEMDKLNPDERIASKNVTAESLIDTAKRIFHPFTFDVRHIAYWSVYEVGQRLTDHFDDVPKAEREQRNPRVFIAGDACHTHSAKAGQGMNVSMNDAYNLGWKIASVLHGTADPKLLHTYNDERQGIAKLLIDFDRKISKLFAAKPKGKDGTDDKDAIDPAVFQEYFEQQGRFMAGVATKYHPGLLTSSDISYQDLAKGFEIGTRFQSCQVLRLADAKPVQLGHVMDADGRWRLVLFGSKADPLSPSSPLHKTCEFLSNTLIPKYTPAKADIDSVLDVRAVLQQSRKTISISDLPEILLPRKGVFGIQDYEKVFTDEASYGYGFGEIFKNRGIDAEKGCVIVVRPDQYVSAVVPLGEEGHGMLEAFFGGFMKAQKRENGVNGHV